MNEPEKTTMEIEKMLDYKLSRYNFTFPYPKCAEGQEQTVMYNTRTGSIALIVADKYRQYCDFAENGTPVSDEELLSDLKLGGYVVDADYDELRAIKYRLLSSRYNTTSLGLTIAPTSNCNFRCIYCYEKDSIKPVTMSEQTQEELIEFVKQYVSVIKSLSISWYGGEPLLAIDIIEKLSNVFMKLCEENKIEYSASMVTNGYLLTPENVKKLHKLKVSSIQVTLDGAAEDHDKRRFLKGGHPTFDRIIENLSASKDNLPGHVAIRINADRHNIDRVDNVVKILREKGLEDKVHPYLAMVENSNDAYNDNSCLHTNEFSQCEFDFITRNGLDIVGRTPQQIGNYCGADTCGSYVINADGRIYRCWDDIGMEERSVGTLKEGPKDCPVMYEFMMYDPTEDPECRDCKFLPVCMGGCPHQRMQNPKIRCTAMKYGLDSFMGVIPELLEQQVDEAKQKEKEQEENK